MSRFFKTFFRLLFNLILVVVLLSGLGLWQLSRNLPAPASKWLKRQLSKGPVSVQFDRASFSPRSGIKLRNVRLYRKKAIDGLLLKADRFNIGGTVTYSKPPAEWIDTVYLQGLEIDSFIAWPSGGEGASLFDWTSLFEPSQPRGALFAQPVTITIRDSTIFGVETTHTSFNLRSRADRLVVENARVEIVTPRFNERLDGELTYNFKQREVAATCRGILTPDAVRQLCILLDGGRVIEILDEFDNYSAPLNVSGSLFISLPEDKDVVPITDLRLTVRGYDLEYRGVHLKRLSGAVQWLKGVGERKLTLSPVNLATREGDCEVAVAYYPGLDEAKFTASSTLALPNLLKLAKIEPEGIVTNIIMRTLPQLDMAGILAYERSANTTLISGRTLLRDVELDGFLINRAGAEFTVRGDNQLDIDNLEITCYDGSIKGDVSLRRQEEDSPVLISANAKLEDAAAPALARDMGWEYSSGGIASGVVKLDQIPLSGDYRYWGHANGTALLYLRKATIFRVPLFAGLTGFVGRNIPGVDMLLMQSNAELPLSLTNGLVTIKQMKVEGNLFSLVASGTCDMADERRPLKGVAQLRFFKQKTLAGVLARLVTLPISKMMEFRVAGTLTEPEWDYLGLIDRIRDVFKTTPKNADAEASGKDES